MGLVPRRTTHKIVPPFLPSIVTLALFDLVPFAIQAAAFAAIARGAWVGPIGLGTRRPGANVAMGGIIFQSTFIAFSRDTVVRPDLIAVAILTAAFTAIGKAAHFGLALLLIFLAFPERGAVTAATVDCEDC